MTERRPLVLIDGTPRELPSGDTLPEDPTLLKDADIGTTVCSQTDPRLSDARTPTAHTHTATNISDSTPAGRALLTAADAAAQRTALDLVKQTDVTDRTEGRVARIDLVPRTPFEEICHIAGIQPTLYLDFARQDFRHYSPATGLREKALSDIVTFTRASSAQYWDAKGVMQLAGNNMPRIDFDPVTGACKGLLIEESRTNLFLNSLLDGANLATQTVTVTAAAHTISFYGTGSITLSGAHSATITGTSDTARTALTFTPSAGSLTCTVSGTVKFAQCELGAFATSFIPTAGATATRAADVAVISGTVFSDFYKNTPFTIFTSVRTIALGYTGVIFNFQTVSEASAAQIQRRNTNTFSYLPADSTTRLESGVSAVGTNDKCAIVRQSGDSALSVNGEPVVTSGVTVVRAGVYVALGSLSNAGSAILNGHIARIAYWPVRLGNGVLQQLTA